MKSKFIGLLILLIFIGAWESLGFTVLAAPVNTVLNAAKDTFVKVGATVDYDTVVAPDYFGYNLRMRNSGGADDLIVFIEFDLSTVTGNITDATLQLNCNSLAKTTTVQAYEIAAAPYSWPNVDDSGLHGGNCPALGNAITGGATSISAMGAVYVNISPYIISQYNSGNKKVTIALKSTAVDSATTVYFNAREGGTPPKLSVNAVPVPSVSFTNIYNNMMYNAGEAVTVTANVKTSGSGVTISNVAFQLDNVMVPGTPATAGSLYTQSISGLTAGTHTIKAVAANSDGGVTATAPITIEVLENPASIIKSTPLPNESSYIVKGNGNNYGASYSLFVKNDSTDSNDQVTYFTFDLSSVTGTIINATVKLNCNSTQAAAPINVTVKGYEVADTSWSTAAITGTNAPALGNVISGASSVINASGDVVYLDVTSYVNSQKALGKHAVSVGIFTEAVSSNYIEFSSKNAAANVAPRLCITSMTNPYCVFSSRFTDSKNINVGSLVMGEQLNSKVSVKNYGAIPLHTTSIIALYDSSDHLVQVNTVNNAQIDAGQQPTLSIGLTLPDHDLTGYYAKAFLWDSLSGLKPFMLPCEIPAP